MKFATGHDSSSAEQLAGERMAARPGGAAWPGSFPGAAWCAVRARAALPPESRLDRRITGRERRSVPREESAWPLSPHQSVNLRFPSGGYYRIDVSTACGFALGPERLKESSPGQRPWGRKA